MPPIIVLSAKRVATQMFVTEKLNEIRKNYFERLCLRYHLHQQETT